MKSFSHPSSGTTKVSTHDTSGALTFWLQTSSGNIRQGAHGKWNVNVLVAIDG
jgi:hypothetical protein